MPVSQKPRRVKGRKKQSFLDQLICNNAQVALTNPPVYTHIGKLSPLSNHRK